MSFVSFPWQSRPSTAGGATTASSSAGRQRPSTAGSFMATPVPGRSATPQNVSLEGSRIRSMMMHRLSKDVSTRRRSSMAQNANALLEFHRRHGINAMRQRSRTMFHLFRRKAIAVGKMIIWCKNWRVEIEAQVRTEDWYLLSEQLLADSGKRLIDEAEKLRTAEFVTLMPVGDNPNEPTGYVELRFNKKDFCVDLKSQSSVLSPVARKALARVPGTRAPNEVTEIVRCLKAHPSFCKFPLQIQKEIALHGCFDCYEKNRILSRWGRRSDGWYIVLLGRLVLRPKTSSGETENSFVDVGQIYGEDEVVLNLRRKYTVVAGDENTEVLYVFKHDYLDAKDRLEGRCRVEDVRRTFSANPTLRHCDFDKLETTEKSWQVQTFQKGAVIASKEPARSIADPTTPDFAVANLTVSDLVDDRYLEKEKKKYFCVVQKGTADIYGVCREAENRTTERKSSDSHTQRMRILKMLDPNENEWRKMDKHVKETESSATGFMLLLPDKWDHLRSNRELNGKVPRRFQRNLPFSVESGDEQHYHWGGSREDESAKDPRVFVSSSPTPESGEKKTTFARIGKADPGAVFGLESAVSAALEPWIREEGTGIQQKACGVNKPPDVYFVSNGCQVILVDKNTYHSGLARDAKCLNASQIPIYHDTASILKATDDGKAWEAEKERLRAHYRDIMAKSKKIITV